MKAEATRRFWLMAEASPAAGTQAHAYVIATLNTKTSVTKAFTSENKHAPTRNHLCSYLCQRTESYYLSLTTHLIKYNVTVFSTLFDTSPYRLPPCNPYVIFLVHITKPYIPLFDLDYPRCFLLATTTRALRPAHHSLNTLHIPIPHLLAL